MDEIKVGYRTYAVKHIEHGDADCYSHFGKTDNNHAVIKLFNLKVLDKEKEVNTLIHEVLHAIWNVYNIGLDGDEEERIVCSLANGLTGVIKDNPALLREIDLQHGLQGE